MTTGKTSSRGLKICCGATAIFLVVVIIVLTTLSLTIFKPKQPEISAKPVGLENIQFSLFPNVTLNVTLGMVFTIENRNYGSFKYKNATAYVHYRDTIVARVPIEQELVPARGKLNITASVDLMADKLISNPHFMEDISSGCLNLTSTTSLHGKVSLFKIFKFHATTFSTCDIWFYIQSKDIDSECKSKIKL